MFHPIGYYLSDSSHQKGETASMYHRKGSFASVSVDQATRPIVLSSAIHPLSGASPSGLPGSDGNRKKANSILSLPFTPFLTSTTGSRLA
jgi:hypothetical protein